MSQKSKAISRQNSLKRQASFKAKRNPMQMSLYKRISPYGINAEHKFKRTVYTSIVIAGGNWFNNASAPGLSLTFSTAGVTWITAGPVTNTFGLPDTTDLSNLFDQIRIDKVVMKMTGLTYPVTNKTVSDASGSAGVSNPILIATDYNDNIVPSTPNSVQSISDCKLIAVTPETPYTKVIIPKFQRLINYTVGTNSFEACRGFVTTTYAVPHYGLKLYLPAIPTNVGTQTIMIAFEFFLTCKNSN